MAPHINPYREKRPEEKVCESRLDCRFLDHATFGEVQTFNPLDFADDTAFERFALDHLGSPCQGCRAKI